MDKLIEINPPKKVRLASPNTTDVAEVTGALKKRHLYSLTNPANSEICAAYKVRVCGFPRINPRIEWCVKAHQIRRLDNPDAVRAATGALTDHLVR